MHVKKELIMLMKKRFLLAILCVSLIFCVTPVMCALADEPETPQLTNIQEEIPQQLETPQQQETPQQLETLGMSGSGSGSTGSSSGKANSTAQDPSTSTGEKATSSIISDGNMTLIISILVVAAGAVAILCTRKRKI